jgi:putative transposase
MKWVSQADEMAPESHTYPGYRFPAEIIGHAVWLYHLFSLSLRDVELILAERGITVSYESIVSAVTRPIFRRGP